MSKILLTAKAAQANAKAKSKVLLIAKAEIKAFWGSQAAALALILFLGLTGFFFYNNTAEYTAKALIAAGHAMSLDASVALFSQGLSHIAVAIMLTAPMLAMRALTPSRRGGRLDFYLGLPLSPRQILGGHYLAILFSMWVFIILALIPFAVLLAQFSVGSPAILASAALGLLLLGAALAAVGLLGSALSASPLGAALISLALSGGLWVLGWAAPYLDGPWGQWWKNLAFMPRIARFSLGLLNFGDVVFLAALAALALLNAGLFLKGRLAGGRL